MTGRTALFIDFSQTLPDALPPCLALVVGPAFLLLLLVFRSLLLPVSAAPGALVAVFRWGWAADFFGIEQTGPVMTTMPIFMIGVFSGFVAEDEDLVAMRGFGLASAVLFDAFVVRMAIVPAVHALLGDAAWWLPEWLGRLLPHVDVEGERLRRRLPSGAPSPAPRIAPEHERDLVHGRGARGERPRPGATCRGRTGPPPSM